MEVDTCPAPHTRRALRRWPARELPAAPPADPTWRARAPRGRASPTPPPPPARPRPRPHAATSIILRTHFPNEPLVGSAPNRPATSQHSERLPQPISRSSPSRRRTPWAWRSTPARRPNIRRARRRWPARARVLQPPRIALDAAGGYERAVVDLRVVAQHRRRQAPRGSVRPATPPPQHHHAPAPIATSPTRRTHFSNEPLEGSDPNRPATSPRPGPPLACRPPRHPCRRCLHCQQCLH